MISHPKHVLSSFNSKNNNNNNNNPISNNNAPKAENTGKPIWGSHPGPMND